MTIEELETFSNTHLFKLASEKFNRMAQLEENGAAAEEISPFMTDIKYILDLLGKRGF